MKVSSFIALLLIAIALSLIIGINPVKYLDLYIFITIVVVIMLIIYKNKKILYKIESIEIKSNIVKIMVGNSAEYASAYKLIARSSSGSIRPNYESEIENLINIIFKKYNNVRVYVFTSFSKEKPGSNLVIFGSDEKIIEEVSKELLKISEVIAPDLQILPVSGVSTEVIAIPKEFGNVEFMKIFDKVYVTSQSESIRTEFDIKIGSSKDKYNLPVGIKLDEMFRHIGIFGTTGSGKTHTSMLLASKANGFGIQVIVFDWHGEYKLTGFNLIDEKNIIKISPLNVDTMSIDEDIDILGDVFQLTDPQRFLLYTILIKVKKMKKINLKILIILLKTIRDTSYWIRDVKYALFRKLYLLFTDEGRKLFDSNSPVNSQNILDVINSSTIINLSFIRNITLKKLYILYLLKLITDYMIKRRPSNKKVLIILEEAHNYLNNNNEFISRIFSEVRKFNIALCVVTQSPSSINKDILKNINTFIIHGIKSDFDKRVLKESLGISEQYNNSIDKLEPGEAYIISPTIKSPILVKIDYTNND